MNWKIFLLPLHRLPHFRLAYWGTGTVVLAILLAGMGYGRWLTQRYEEIYRQQLQYQAAIIAKSLDYKVIFAFDEDRNENSDAEIERIQSYFQNLDQEIPDAHCIYLIGQRGDGGFSFVSKDGYSDSREHVLRCIRHNPSVSSLADAFKEGKPVVLGPFALRKTLWLSALAPIVNRASGKVVAVLGVDAPYADCYSGLFGPLLYVALTTLLMMICVIAGVGFYYVRRRHPEKRMKIIWEPASLALFGLLLSLAVAMQIRWSEQLDRRLLFLQLA